MRETGRERLSEEVMRPKIRAEMKTARARSRDRAGAMARSSPLRQAWPDMADKRSISSSSGAARAACARRASPSGYGASVMVAEEYRVGGTCVIRGCVPEEAAGLCRALCRRVRGRRRLRLDRWASRRFDWPTLIANKDREIARLEAGLYVDARDARGSRSSRAARCSTTPHTRASRRHRRDASAPSTS